MNIPLRSSWRSLPGTSFSCDNLADFSILPTSEPKSRSRFGSSQLRSGVSYGETCILQRRKSAPAGLQDSLSVEFMFTSVFLIWYPDGVRKGGGSTSDYPSAVPPNKTLKFCFLLFNRLIFRLTFVCDTESPLPYVFSLLDS